MARSTELVIERYLPKIAKALEGIQQELMLANGIYASSVSGALEKEKEILPEEQADRPL